MCGVGGGMCGGGRGKVGMCGGGGGGGGGGGSSRQREPRFLPAPARPHCILLLKKFSMCLYPWLDECERSVCEGDALCVI